MAALNLSHQDLTELLVILNTALVDSQTVMRGLVEQEHINTRRAYEDTIRKWIHVLSQQPGFEHYGMEGE